MKQWKRIISVCITAVLLCTLLAACGATSTATTASVSESTAESATTATTASGATDVVFLYMGPVEFFTGLSDSFKAALEAEGYTYESAQAGFNPATQNDQIDNYITKGAKVLVLTAVDADAVKDAAKRAKDAGIKVIAFTVDLGAESQDLYMGSNEQLIGETVATIGKEWADYKGNTYTADDILVIGNSSNSSSIERSQSIVASAEELFGITLADSNKKLDWSKETADVQSAFETYWTATTKKPKIILCYNSEMALGVNAFLMTTGVVDNVADYCVVGADAGAILGEMGKAENETAIRGISSLDGAEGITSNVTGFVKQILNGEEVPAEDLGVPFEVTGSWKQ